MKKCRVEDLNRPGNIVLFKTVVEAGTRQTGDTTDFANIAAGVIHQIAEVIFFGLPEKFFELRKMSRLCLGGGRFVLGAMGGADFR